MCPVVLASTVHICLPRPSLGDAWALDLRRRPDLRAKAGKTGRDRRKTEMRENFKRCHGFLFISGKSTWDPPRKGPVACFVTRICDKDPEAHVESTGPCLANWTWGQAWLRHSCLAPRFPRAALAGQASQGAGPRGWLYLWRPRPYPAAQRVSLAWDSNTHISHLDEGFAFPAGIFPGRGSLESSCDFWPMICYYTLNNFHCQFSDNFYKKV